MHKEVWRRETVWQPNTLRFSFLCVISFHTYKYWSCFGAREEPNPYWNISYPSLPITIFPY